MKQKTNETPMMKEWREIKEKNPNAILFFRLGDFYETFFGDAEKVAPILRITLTNRKGILMAGVPACGDIEGYAKAINAAGMDLAICDTQEIERKTKRIVTKVFPAK